MRGARPSITARLLLMGTVVLLGGCSGTTNDPAGTTPHPGSSDPSPADGQTPEPSAPGESPAPAPIPNWGTLQYEGSGAAGSWVIGFQPVEAAISSYELSFSAQATGNGVNPVGLLVFAPQLTVRNETIDLVGEAHPRFVVAPRGGSISWSQDLSVGASTGTVPGIFFAIASWGGDWTFSFTLDKGEGPTVSPAFLRTGPGTEFAYGAPLTPGTGQTILESEIRTPGWSHVSVLFHNPPLCPREGSRQHDYTFPDGVTRYQTGWVPNARYDFAGTFSDLPGSLRALVDYQEVSAGVELALMHLPVTSQDFPTGFATGGYQRANGDPCED